MWSVYVAFLIVREKDQGYSHRDLACASHAHHVAHVSHGAVHGAASGTGASSRGASGHTHIHDD